MGEYRAVVGGYCRIRRGVNFGCHGEQRERANVKLTRFECFE